MGCLHSGLRLRYKNGDALTCEHAGRTKFKKVIMS